MPRARITERDWSLAHQIILTQSQSRGATHIAVSCNCQRRGSGHGFAPFAEVSSKEDPWPAYNDPTNHDHSKETFVPRAQHTANMKVYWVS